MKKSQQNFLNRVWNALDYSYGAQWFKDLCKGNEDILALGCNDKVAFLKFDGDDSRYFSMAELKEPVDMDSEVLGEIREATAELYSQYTGTGAFVYNSQSMHFYSYDTPKSRKKRWWVLTLIKDIEAA